MAITWYDLPRVVRELAGDHVGVVADAVSVDEGNHASLAVSLRHADGSKSFAKGAPTDDIEGRLIRYESRVLPAVSSFAPRLLGLIEAGGWTVILLEHIDGRHADYSPGSPDLVLLGKLINALQNTPCPDAVAMQIKDRWKRFGDTSAMDGTALLHTDLNQANVMVTGDRAVLVDWAFASRGAAWLELAQLAPWLLKGGHSPREADQWLSQFPSWGDASPDDIDRHAGYLVQRWGRRPERSHDPWIDEYAMLAQHWANHRGL